VSDLLSDVTSAALAKSLDAAGLRHRVIADNIANVETPGFIRSDVTFGDQLRAALSAGDPDTAMRRVKSIEPEVEVDSLSPPGPNGNNVSIDKEMAELTKNDLQYETLVQLINLKGSMVKAAITEGKR
jgi:flagellar basal-body rod protein FlgB